MQIPPFPQLHILSNECVVGPFVVTFEDASLETAETVITSRCPPPHARDCFKRFKNLRVLYLWDGFTDVLAALDMDITPLLAAPRLRKLCINRWSFDEDASDLPRILLSTNPQLEELTLEDISTEFVDSRTVQGLLRLHALKPFDAWRCSM
ncbi:hypothetical protein BDN71DRAFT_1504466 [Pleurotus eryngii]|uniref:Uncharacterized protein n=1 Tax=Pleurotus eryngii TaxID=5323 RepID=A0A9P6A4R1_PLEER|nr:hypothetical protein BDN71DRAFT_1504466 [Pleurotus eryngii]